MFFRVELGGRKLSLEAYRRGLDDLVGSPAIQSALREIIDRETVVCGQKEFHDIQDATHLEELFRAASEWRPELGRLIIRDLGPALPGG